MSSCQEKFGPLKKEKNKQTRSHERRNPLRKRQADGQEADEVERPADGQTDREPRVMKAARVEVHSVAGG